MLEKKLLFDSSQVKEGYNTIPRIEKFDEMKDARQTDVIW